MVRFYINAATNEIQVHEYYDLQTKNGAGVMTTMLELRMRASKLDISARGLRDSASMMLKARKNHVSGHAHAHAHTHPKVFETQPSVEAEAEEDERERLEKAQAEIE